MCWADGRHALRARGRSYRPFQGSDSERCCHTLRFSLSAGSSEAKMDTRRYPRLAGQSLRPRGKLHHDEKVAQRRLGFSDGKRAKGLELAPRQARRRASTARPSLGLTTTPVHRERGRM